MKSSRNLSFSSSSLLRNRPVLSGSDRYDKLDGDTVVVVEDGDEDEDEDEDEEEDGLKR